MSSRQRCRSTRSECIAVHSGADALSQYTGRRAAACLERQQVGGRRDFGALLQGAPQQHKGQQHGWLLEEGGPRQPRRRCLHQQRPVATEQTVCTRQRAGLMQQRACGSQSARRQAAPPAACCRSAEVSSKRRCAALTATHDTLQAAQAPIATNEFMSGAPRRRAFHPSSKISLPGPVEFAHGDSNYTPAQPPQSASCQ